MKTFIYRFSDGSEINREPTNATMNEIKLICEQQGIALIYNGFHDQLDSLQLLRANSHKTKTDGFQPGWHPGLNMEIRTNGQYQSVLKERGMVEIGNERQKDHVQKSSNVFTEEIIKDAVAAGADISGNEADKLLGVTE
jgi:hypothetical protein